MNAINFGKLHGFGNDYIVVEKDELTETGDIGEFTRKICHRHLGVGGDGIALLEKLHSKEADYSCRIINPDGSEAGFSGNGTRCAVAYLYYKNLWSGENLRLKTKSGIKNYQFLEREQNTFWYLAELGRPHSISDFKVQISDSGDHLPAITMDVGNPVCAIFVESFDAFDWRRIGSEIEVHPNFPDRTNVVFIKVSDRRNIEIRIWERGAGETSSSGTCSIAAAVACAFTGKTERKVSVQAPGGTTEAVWREADDEMMITGRADLVFCGEWIYKSKTGC